jgi:hypothetical protein
VRCGFSVLSRGQDGELRGGGWDIRYSLLPPRIAVAVSSGSPADSHYSDHGLPRCIRCPAVAVWTPHMCATLQAAVAPGSWSSSIRPGIWYALSPKSADVPEC